MGFDNPSVPWSEIERVLSDRRRPTGRPAGADGGDSPAWSHKRGPYVPPGIARPAEAIPYAELHAHSSFSFLDGASSPEELAEEAEEYVRGVVHTQNIESFWSLLKRGVVGNFHQVSRKYLPLYLAEFTFRHNHRDDTDMFGALIAGC